MKSPVYGLAMICLISGSAMAQTATSTSNSGSTSTSNAAAAAQAAAAAIARGGSAHNQSSFRSPRAPGAIGLPGLAASGGCMGSTSIGASFIGGGVGLGSSWQDQRCNAREDARLLAAFGYQREALQLLINNSPMIQQVMVPAVAVEPRASYHPVSLSNDSPAINGVRQLYRGGSHEIPERCAATLGLLQQQDAYLKNIVLGKPRPNAKRNALLVQENLRTGIGNLSILCPAAVAKRAGDEIGGRIGQIDDFVSSGRWTGPVG